MNAGLFAQYAVIAMVVLASAWLTLRKLLPQPTSRWLATMAIRFNQPGSAPWRRAFGRWLQPAQAAGDCSDGCSTCSNCGPTPPTRVDVQPLEFRPRVK